MIANALVTELERRLLPALHAVAAQLRADFPRVRVDVESHAYGPVDGRAGHNFYVSCLFDRPPPDEPDHVSIEVCVPGAYGPDPRVSADVIWGHPSGRTEGEVFADGDVALTAGTLREVEAALPALATVLRGALGRGRPPADAGGTKPSSVGQA